MRKGPLPKKALKEKKKTGKRRLNIFMHGLGGGASAPKAHPSPSPHLDLPLRNSILFFTLPN